MDLKEAIMQIPELVKNIKDKFFVEEQKFIDSKLADGTIIQYDELKEGVAVSVISEDGSKIPLADGVYDTEDGIKIEIVGGVIKQFKENTQQPNENNPQEMEVAQPQEQSISKIVESIIKETVFSKEEVEKKIEQEFNKLVSENESLKKEIKIQKELTKEIFSIVEKIASMPSEISKIEKKDGIKNNKKETKSVDLDEFRKQYFN
jgi:hypothetical protein